MFGCVAPLRGTGEQELVFMNVCIGVSQKRGKYLNGEPDVCVCVWIEGTFDSLPKCVCFRAAASARTKKAALSMFTLITPELSATTPAAFNTCSSQREHTPPNLEDDGKGAGVAAS